MCGCGRGTSTAPLTYQVRLPDGTIRPYSSEIAAKAKVKTTPGAELLNPSGASV